MRILYKSSFPVTERYSDQAKALESCSEAYGCFLKQLSDELWAFLRLSWALLTDRDRLPSCSISCEQFQPLPTNEDDPRLEAQCVLCVHVAQLDSALGELSRQEAPLA